MAELQQPRGQRAAEHGKAVQPLGHLGTVRQGVHLPPQLEGLVACLQASDFDNQGRLVREVRREFALSARQERHLLSGGEILLVSKGVQLRACLVPSEVLPAVAGTSFAVICDLETHLVLPAYLAWWLNSAEGQAALLVASTATDIRSIKLDAVAAIEIPLPSLDTQAQVVKAQAKADRLRELRMQLADVEYLLHARLLSEFIKH